MTSIHPHWHATEEEEIVPIRTKKSDEKAPIRVSRLPAAMVGILLLFGIAIVSFGGIQSLLGQLTNPTPDITIHLKNSGPDPSPAIVSAGQIVRFVNDDSIPHVLSSTTLPTESTSPFSTPGMYAGNDYFYTIPANAAPGTYDYISETNPEFAGEIVVTVPVVTSSSSVAVLAVSPSSSSAVPVALPIQQSSSIKPLPAGIIAVNPHVVGTKKQSSSTKQGVTQHKPTKNTESGPAIWIAVMCVVLASAITAQRAWRGV